MFCMATCQPPPPRVLYPRSESSLPMLKLATTKANPSSIFSKALCPAVVGNV